MRTRLFLALAGVLSLVLGAHSAARAPQAAPRVPFTAEDMTNVASISVADLSDDGARVAVTLRRSGDNAEVDNYRYGDPTYVSPARVRLVVIDTQTGNTQAPFKDAVNLSRAAWSHDGSRLAILLLERAAAAVPAAPPARRVPQRAAAQPPAPAPC